ncbi:MAG TPA: DCC1-like thiol-disulfide oxidoreductase family protein [Solirubrobacteraceae bacterium]|nr:DCC1-like thiol-disulfide oxidoreductase family protein [Solirubrobacteraceae bacterium]
MIVLYDNDCGFCRWSIAWALRHDARQRLVAVPIQSQLGAELLAELDEDERLRSAHVIDEHGARRSGGAAAADVLSTLAPTRALGRLANLAPAPTSLLYGYVASHRHGVGRFVGVSARRRADELLDAVSVRTAAELDARSRTGAATRDAGASPPRPS